MEIQNSAIAFPTARGTAQRSTRSLVTRQVLLPRPEASSPAIAQPASAAVSLPTTSPLQQASLIHEKPIRQASARQAIATYRAINQFHNHPGGELLNRIDTRA